MWPFKKKSKVFCEDCVYSRLYSNLTEDERRHCIETAYSACFNPALTLNHYDKDTAYSRGSGELYLTQYRSCAYYNSRNDCTWFESKEKK